VGGVAHRPEIVRRRVGLKKKMGVKNGRMRRMVRSEEKLNN